MKKLKSATAALLLLLLCLGPHKATAQVIPAPVRQEARQGTFDLSAATRLYTNLKGRERRRFRAYLATLPLNFAKGRARDEQGTLRLIKTPLSDTANPEAYRLSVTPQGATVRANTSTGLFYGFQTLLQLGTQRGETMSVPCTEVSDEPRFAWRGFELDIARHFFDKNFIKKQIRALARYKINVLHLHLADNGGWRLEIKKYPQLTEKAAWRTASDWEQWHRRPETRIYCTADTPGAYGGYLTQRDAREIVEYAAIHHMEVVPEFDVPGHNGEVFWAFPELACPGQTGFTSSELCIGNEKSFTVYENVLREVMRIFPSRYIHMGGDEAVRSRWEACPRCRERMAREHIADVAGLQNYMMLRMERFLNRHGRTMIGWDEVLEGDISQTAVIMSWRGTGAAAEQARRRGNKVIMSPTAYCYLDYYQDEYKTEPRAIGGYVPLEKTYSFDPDPENSGAVIGVQGNLWTEFVETPSHAEHMMYPRILAVAEDGWTPQSRKDYADFHARALQAVSWLQAKGYSPFDLKNELGKRSERFPWGWEYNETE